MDTPKLLTDLGIGGCFNFEKDAHIFEDVISIVKPKKILETGFFCGLSSFIWLYLSQADVTSVDPMVNLYDPEVKHDGKIENVQKLRDAFPNRFTFIQKDSCFVRPYLIGQQFDLFLVDGDHWERGIMNDLQMAIDLKIPYILLDDFVTEVEYYFVMRFASHFTQVKMYDRADMFRGKPIPMGLFKTKLT